MDREVFEKFLNQQVQIVNDEHFVITGVIESVFNNTVAIFSDGKVKYLSFNRILEIRPIGSKHP